MSSRFTALPLSSGESFVLETEHRGRPFVILFDGGQSKTVGPENGLYRALTENCPEVQSRIDVAICSHSDHDHSGGFPSFVETWVSEGGEFGEFWLPALWSPAVRSALMDPDILMEQLVEGAFRAAQKMRAPDAGTLAEGEFRQTSKPLGVKVYENAIDALRGSASRTSGSRPANTILERRRDTRAEETASSIGLSMSELRSVRRLIEDEHGHALVIPNRVSLPMGIRSRSSRALSSSLLSSVVETAEAIRKIATVAAQYLIPIRWFDFTPFEGGEAPEGGIEGLIVPLNTVEIDTPQVEPDSLRLFYSLKLTEQNVSSLVFQRIETKNEPSVIFLADSRLAFGIDEPERDFPNHLHPFERECVFTAAHHGSRNNDRAYEVLQNWLGDLFPASFAVRNGGVHNQTLQQFLEHRKRRCAQCYQCHGGAWSQAVILQSTAGNWTWPPAHGSKCGIPNARIRARIANAQ